MLPQIFLKIFSQKCSSCDYYFRIHSTTAVACCSDSGTLSAVLSLALLLYVLVSAQLGDAHRTCTTKKYFKLFSIERQDALREPHLLFIKVSKYVCRRCSSERSSRLAVALWLDHSIHKRFYLPSA